MRDSVIVEEQVDEDDDLQPEEHSHHHQSYANGNSYKAHTLKGIRLIMASLSATGAALVKEVALFPADLFDDLVPVDLATDFVLFVILLSSFEQLT
jgi:hypothetical protein